MSYSRIQQEKEFHNQRFRDEVDRRSNLSKYYAITGSSVNYYYDLLRAGAGERVLEYGCGTGSAAFWLAAGGAAVTGIDIADTAIERASREAKEKGQSINFRVMNAEALDLPDDSFDLICGSGILHHLDLNQAYAELARVLSPEGRVVFREPLGHNLFVNLYRWLTPTLRTETEHPLLLKDLDTARLFFDRVEVKYFYLLALLVAPVAERAIFGPLLAFLERVDRRLFSLLPFTRRYAWIAVMAMAQPKKDGPAPLQKVVRVI